ncbi:MAG TPA: cytochrome c [Acetobacteraceae bacterium]|nr:cytochrome c [Acetobacteraceae bacterium]
MLHSWRILSAFGVVAIAAAAVPAFGQTPFTLKSVSVDLPSGTRTFSGVGASIVNQNCLGCHSAGIVLNQPDMPKASWAIEVDKMRHAFKAPMDAKDVPAIIAYLARIKGTK